MTNAEVVTALGDMAVAIDDPDWAPHVLYAQTCFAAGLYNAAADAFSEVTWAAFLGSGPMYEDVRQLNAEIALRRQPARPPDLTPPSRYGHLRG